MQLTADILVVHESSDRDLSRLATRVYRSFHDHRALAE